MKARRILAAIISACILFSLSGCSFFSDDTDENEFEPAEVQNLSDIPVDEEEIIDYFNTLITYIETDGSFPADKKPGIKTTESFSVDKGSIRLFKADGSEDAGLDTLSKAAKKIADEITGGVDVTYGLVPFGEAEGRKASEVIYPFDSDRMALTSADVKNADCSVDADDLNIVITLSDTPEAVGNVFGIRDKNAVLEKINDFTSDYALVTDYEMDYAVSVPEDAAPIESTITLCCELEKLDDGSYKCTGRIDKFTFTVNSDVTAYITCGGSFADNGDIQMKFRLTETRNYEFDWYGAALWEE